MQTRPRQLSPLQHHRQFRRPCIGNEAMNLAGPNLQRVRNWYICVYREVSRWSPPVRATVPSVSCSIPAGV